MPVPPKQSSNREPIEAGTHLAICTMVAEIGTHERVWKGEVKNPYEVVLSFDFPDLRIEIERDGKKLDLPRRKSRTFTFSYHEKSNLGKMLKGWLGKQPEQDFDLFDIVGKNAMVTISHTVKDGNTYDNIETVSPLMARMTPVESENDLLRYGINENGKTIPDGIPDWVKEKIKSSREFEYMNNAGERLNSADGPITDTTDYGEPDDSQIPF